MSEPSILDLCHIFLRHLRLNCKHHKRDSKTKTNIVRIHSDIIRRSINHRKKVFNDIKDSHRQDSNEKRDI